jgi:hypothetical protein
MKTMQAAAKGICGSSGTLPVEKMMMTVMK